MAILTISREFGSGGEEIGRAVAESMGYEFVDRERMLADIGTLGHRWQELGRSMDEHSPSIWERYDWSFKAFAAVIQKTILDCAVRDRVVIVGRGAGALLQRVPYALKTRMTAPLETRVERIMKRESVDLETAKWLIRRTDRERAGYRQSLYGRAWDAADQYDLVFDTSLLGWESIVSTIREQLGEKDRLKTKEAEQYLRRLAVAGHVKAGILTHGRFFVPTLDVEVDREGIRLLGVVHNLKQHDELEREARELAGDTPLRCDLTFRR